MTKVADPPELEATHGSIEPGHRVPSFLARRFRQLCLGIMSEVLEPAGLKPVEYAALTMLDALPGLDQRGLASRLAIDPVSAHHLAQALERRGWVKQRQDPADRRSRSLHLTPEGLALRRRLQPAALAAQQRILAPLAPEERPVLIDLLTRAIEGNQTYARPGNGRRRPSRSPPKA